jgi:multiple sugar transport system substrate-binding protein
VNPDNPAKSWAEFERVCGRSKKGQAPIAMGGTGYAPLVWDWPEMQKNYWKGDQDILEFGRGNIPWTDPRMVSGLKQLTSMADKGWFQEGWATMQGIPDALDVFSSGGAAFIGSIISDVANWKQYEEALGQDKVGVMLWPAVNPANPLMKKFSGFQGFQHGIAKWSKNPKEAWEYIKFLASAEGGNLFLKHAGGQPINKKFDKSIAGGSPNFAKIQQIIRTSGPGGAADGSRSKCPGQAGPSTGLATSGGMGKSSRRRWSSRDKLKWHRTSALPEAGVR